MLLKCTGGKIAPSARPILARMEKRPAALRRAPVAMPSHQIEHKSVIAHSPSNRRCRVIPKSASSESPPATDGATPAGNSTFVQAVFNVVNVMMGVGLLSLPFALKSSGWVGIGLLWLMGFVTNYTGKALVECAQAVAKRRNLGNAVVGYEEIAEETFGSIGKAIISAIIYVELFGTCCVMFILEGDNAFNLFGASSAFTNAGAYMLAAACLMIPTVWLPDLSALSVLGFFGVTATCTVTASVLYTLLSGSFVPGAVTDAALWATLPLVFGIMTFCYSGHGVFPAIQASMKEPSKVDTHLNYK